MMIYTAQKQRKKKYRIAVYDRDYVELEFRILDTRTREEAEKAAAVMVDEYSAAGAFTANIWLIG